METKIIANNSQLEGTNFKLVELHETKYNPEINEFETTIFRYAYDSNIVTTEEDLKINLYDVYEIEYIDDSNWKLKNVDTRYGVMCGEAKEIATLNEHIKWRINNSKGAYSESRYLH